MSWKETLWVRTWAFLKIPALWFVRPSVLELSDRRVEVRIPFRRRTKNHLGSIYFGVLCIGADTAGGLIAMRRIQQTGNEVSLIFKDFQAEFLKRAEGPVHFICDEGEAVSALVDEALRTGERVTMPVHVTAVVPSISDEPVARFVLGLSLKRRRRD